MLSVKNEFIDYLLTRGRVVYNLTLPYQDINILLIDLPPYGNNKYVIYVDSFIGIFIYSFIDFNPLVNENIYEINIIKYDLAESLYYSRISSMITNIVNNFITKSNIYPINIGVKDFVCFVPFEVFYEGDVTSLNTLYKEVDDGIFIERSEILSRSFIIDSSNNLVNKFTKDVIDNNVEKIYGCIYFDKILYGNVSAFYEAAVYKKYGSNDKFVYFKNTYLNISTIRNVGDLFSDSDFTNSRVYISFIPSNVIIYVNNSNVGFKFYRLLDYSVNQIKLYLKKMYGLDFVDILNPNKFYPSKFKSGYTRFKKSRNYSGQENIPTYIYCKDDIVAGIADKIFNFAYFDLTESSVVRSDIPTPFMSYQNNNFAYSILNNNFYRVNINTNNINPITPDLIGDWIVFNDQTFDISNVDIVIPTNIQQSDFTNIFVYLNDTTFIDTYFLNSIGDLFIRIPSIPYNTTYKISVYLNKYLNNKKNNYNYLNVISNLVAYYDLNIKSNNYLFINEVDSLPANRARDITYDTSGSVFNGTTSWLQIPTLPIRNIGNKFTIVTRFMPNSQTAIGSIMSGYRRTSGYQYFGLQINGQSVNGSIGVAFGRHGEYQRFVRSNANRLVNGSQYNVACTYNGGTTNSALRLWVDKTEVNDVRSDSGSYTASTDVDQWFICVADGADFFNGKMDKLLIFNNDYTETIINSIIDNQNNLYADNTNLYILNNYSRVTLCKYFDITNIVNSLDFTHLHIIRVSAKDEINEKFPVLLRLDTSSLINRGLLSVDGTDLMFFDSVGRPIPYYIQANQNTNRTEIQIGLSSLYKDSVIYMASGSNKNYRSIFNNPDLVFLLFDDFTAYDYNKQLYSGTTPISNGIISLNTSSNYEDSQISPKNLTKNYPLEMLSIVAGNSTNMRFFVRMGSNYQYVYDDLASSNMKGLFLIGGSSAVDNWQHDHGSDTFSGSFRIKILRNSFNLQDPVAGLRSFRYAQNIGLEDPAMRCQYTSYILIDRICIKRSLTFEPICNIIKYYKIK